MTDRKNGALYTGVTSDLPKRAWEHKQGAIDGFTARYGCKLLVWYEFHATMESGVRREKQIKGGSRRKKIELIEAANPDWRDLFEQVNH